MAKQERAVRTRQTLIRAAAEVFAADGYALASLSVISQRAGVSAGALHFHFAGKDDLAREVESAAADSVQQMAEGNRRTAGSPLQSLVRTVFGLLVAAAEDPVVRAGFKLSGDPSRKSDAEMLRWWRAFVHELVLQAQEAGELAQDVSADDATTAIVAATVGFEVISMVDAEWPSVDRVARFWSLVLPWLAAYPDRVLAAVTHGARQHEGVH
ncbi:ScbR family autoregulator-binding transcription factor [Streptomyces sp. NK08204]|uniref:ScbR family autoregulator-binding transcription factor n=1 Tax=Streptomyces sp. NK08204 TaxID=2873260 RepID=UPI001CECEC14|nr:ScbR family autoregulator-binding transcription factor [Streptomyces sp. NK08204]